MVLFFFSFFLQHKNNNLSLIRNSNSTSRPNTSRSTSETNKAATQTSNQPQTSTVPPPEVNKPVSSEPQQPLQNIPVQTTTPKTSNITGKLSYANVAKCKLFTLFLFCVYLFFICSKASLESKR